MKLNLVRGLYIIALAHLIIELCMNFLPVIYPVFITTMGLTYAQIGFVALVVGVGATLSQPLFGYVSDRWNPYHITVLSILWIGFFMGLVGLTPTYSVLLLIVGLGSLGSAAFHPAGATIASVTSTTRRGTAVSIFSVGGNLGSALSPLIIAIAVSWMGLRGTIILIPAALVAGLLLHRQFSSTEAQATAKNQSAQQLKQRSSAPGSLTGLILIIAAVMTRTWFQVSLVTYLPEWMQKQGWSLAAGGQILAVSLVAVSIGSLLGGNLSDRIGRWQIVALSMILMSPVTWLFVTTSGMLQVVMVGLIGVLIGASFPVTIVMAQEAWPRGIGMASALVLGLGWLPGGIGASFTGFLADQTSLQTALQSLVIPPIIGLACILAYAVLIQYPARNRVLPDAAGPKLQ